MKHSRPSPFDAFEFMCAVIVIRRKADLVIKPENFRVAVESIAAGLGRIGAEITPDVVADLSRVTMSDIVLRKGEVHLVFNVAHAHDCMPALRRVLSRHYCHLLKRRAMQLEGLLLGHVLPAAAAAK